MFTLSTHNIHSLAGRRTCVSVTVAAQITLVCTIQFELLHAHRTTTLYCMRDREHHNYIVTHCGNHSIFDELYLRYAFERVCMCVCVWKSDTICCVRILPWNVGKISHTTQCMAKGCCKKSILRTIGALSAESSNGGLRNARTDTHTHRRASRHLRE